MSAAPPPAAPPPDGTRRLFPHDEAPVPLAPEQRSHLLARLLEEGDGADLAWLTAHLPEAELADWLRRRGGRLLSRRSRVFWRLLLAVEPGPAAPGADQLWVL